MSESKVGTSKEEKKAPCICVMSHKRLKGIEGILRDTYGEEGLEEVMIRIKESINFNDNYRKGQYTPEMGKRMYEYKQKKAAEKGVTVYAMYEKKTLSRKNMKEEKTT